MLVLITASTLPRIGVTDFDHIKVRFYSLGYIYLQYLFVIHTFTYYEIIFSKACSIQTVSIIETVYMPT